MKDIAFMIICLGIAVVLPITLYYFSVKKKIEAERIKKDIILAALEKDSSLDLEELVRKTNTPSALLKEKLLAKLLWGLCTSFLGITSLIIAMCVGGFNADSLHILVVAGAILLSIGVASIISYFVGKKLLAKEMAAEEQNLIQANKK